MSQTSYLRAETLDSRSDNSDLTLPTQAQLMLPMLHALRDRGGAARPGAIYDDIAARLGLRAEIREARVDAGTAGDVNAFERRVRWTRQSAVLHGLISRERRNLWELTDKANTQLRNIVRGAMLTVFTTESGAFLWARAEDAVGIIERGSVDLIFSSPPYPGANKSYQAGEDASTSTWLDEMLRLCEGWRELLTPTGSMMLNLGPVFEHGRPTQSLYIERLLIRLEDALGIHLLQRLDWHSPTKLPAPLEWVGVRRIRVKPSIEPILWLSPNPYAAGDNRRVLKPYSAGARRAIANPQSGTRTRPSGFRFGPSSFVDNGGAIPPSLIVASNASSNNAYRRAERAAGRTPHPAMMPDRVAEFGIKLATTEGDLVYDPFAGAGTIPLAAERLKRRWIANDRSLEFARSARINFEANRIQAATYA
jgi:site-specific DNA-methyltransferase (cytosine-N4-specific)